MRPNGCAARLCSACGKTCSSAALELQKITPNQKATPKRLRSRSEQCEDSDALRSQRLHLRYLRFFKMCEVLVSLNIILEKNRIPRYNPKHTNMKIQRNPLSEKSTCNHTIQIAGQPILYLLLISLHPSGEIRIWSIESL